MVNRLVNESPNSSTKVIFNFWFSQEFKHIKNTLATYIIYALLPTFMETKYTARAYLDLYRLGQLEVKLLTLVIFMMKL